LLVSPWFPYIYIQGLVARHNNALGGFHSNLVLLNSREEWKEKSYQFIAVDSNRCQQSVMTAMSSTNNCTGTENDETRTCLTPGSSTDNLSTCDHLEMRSRSTTGSSADILSTYDEFEMRTRLTTGSSAEILSTDDGSEVRSRLSTKSSADHLNADDDDEMVPRKRGRVHAFSRGFGMPSFERFNLSHLKRANAISAKPKYKDSNQDEKGSKKRAQKISGDDAFLIKHKAKQSSRKRADTI